MPLINDDIIIIAFHDEQSTEILLSKQNVTLAVAWAYFMKAK